MKKTTSAIIGLLAVLAMSLSGLSNSYAEPPASTPAPPPAAGPEQSAGPFCVDYYSKKLGADGNSIKVASACSPKSIAAAQAAAEIALQSVSATQRGSTTLTSTLLMTLFIDYNGGTLQRTIFGTSGPCDGTGYTFNANAADVGRLSSSLGYNGCNAVRLTDGNGFYGYFYQYPGYANWPGAFNDGTHRYHPYCTC